jgi:hypothetical protein
MINRWVLNYQKDSFIESHRFLFVYAHIIGFIHGIGFLLQGKTKLVGPIKHAFHLTDAWHGGLPAISIFSISFMAGISVILLSVISLGLIFFKLKPKIIILWFLVFLSGSGFVYLLINMIAYISLFIMKTHRKNQSTVIGKSLIMLLTFWLFGSWFFGWILQDLMYMLSPAIFLVFDILIPIIIVISHRKTFLIKINR